MFNSNKQRGISFNRNALNIQQEPPRLAPSIDDPTNLDNLKAAALSLENPLPLSHLQPQKLDINPLKKLFSIDTNNTHSDENAITQQQLPLGEKLRQLKAFKKPQDEDKVLINLEIKPPPPMLDENKDLIDLDIKPPTLQDENKDLINLDNKPPPLQESNVSRIPRLSLRLPQIPLRSRLSSVIPPKQTIKQTHSSQLCPMKEEKVAVVEEKEDEEEEIEDIDKSASSRDAIYMVSDVAKDIYDYMYALEKAQSVREDYLKEQKVFTPKVRQRLMNWCIEIHTQLKLLPETLYTSIGLMDRYFDKVRIKQQSEVQLAAVGCTLIASKYEEIYPPDVGDLIHLTQNSYTRREVMKIEISILEQLNYDLGKPIPLAFLRRYSKAAHCDLKMHSIAKYLMELSLTEYECSHWRPSLLAAASLFVTIHLVHAGDSGTTISSSGNQYRKNGQKSMQDRWNKALIHYTQYTRRDLQKPAAMLCKILKKAQKSPQSYYCVKKNVSNLSKWPELKSVRVDELIKQGDQM